MLGGLHYLRDDRRILSVLFINTLPIRIDVGDRGVEDSVRDTQRLLAQLIRHEHAPLALAQRCSGVPGQTPLFSALFNYRYSRIKEDDLSDGTGPKEMEILWEGEERTNYPVTLSVDDMGDDFKLTAQVSRPIAPERVCAFMQTALENLANALEKTPQLALCRVEALPSSERAQVLVQLNTTVAEHPPARCLHELFEEQVAKTPEAVAVVCGAESLSYQKLNSQANQLARYLRSLGVGPEVRVAVCLERSLEMIVALLGTLKAGGAYVPLDPGYPADRLRTCSRTVRPRWY